MVSWGQGKSLIRNKNQQSATASKVGWGGTISFNSEKTLDEFEKPYWGTGAEISYTLREETTFVAHLGFAGPYAHQDADPALVQGVDDFGIDWAEKWGMHPDWGTLASKVGVDFPTSELSRRQTKYIGSKMGLSLATPFWGVLSRFTLLTALGINVASHRYDFADATGTSYNSPFTGSEGLGLAWRMGWGFTWTNMYTYAQRYDYGGKWTPVQRYVSSLAFDAGHGVGISAAYKWADRVFTNDPAFTSRLSSITGEVSYAF